MTLSVKALTQQRRRAPNERRCATSGTIYDETTGKPLGQRAPFTMWRRFPHRVHTHLYKPAIHSHLPDPFPTEKYQVVPRDSLACDTGCWSKSDISKNCYLNGSTQEYTKDTCENSATMKKCGLGVDVAGSRGRNLNIGTTRHNGPVLPRTNRAFLLQPGPIVKSGIVLRGPGSCETTQQMFQQDGIDYERGGRCNVPGRVVPIENTAAAVRVYEMYLPNKQSAFSPALAYADDRLYIVANNNLYSGVDITGYKMPTYTTISTDLGTDMIGFDGVGTPISWPVQGAIAANPYGIFPTTFSVRIALSEAIIPGGGNQFVTLSVNNGNIEDYNGNVPVGFKSPLMRVNGFVTEVTDAEGMAMGFTGDVYMRLRDDATSGVADAFVLDSTTATPGTYTYDPTLIIGYTTDQRDGAGFAATNTTSGDMLWFIGGGDATLRASTTVRWSLTNGTSQGNSNLNIARSYASVVVDSFTNRLYVIGGFDASGNALDSYEYIEMSTNPAQPYVGNWIIGDWTLTHARGLAGAALTPEGIVIAGGAQTLDYATSTPGTALNTIEILGLTAFKYTQPTTLASTKTHPPAQRLGAMPSSTYANHQRVMSTRNRCSDSGPCY